MADAIAPDYGQQFLFPPALEDWVPAYHPARFLREFVDQLDLPVHHFALPAGSEGRPPFAPSLLLKIWLYGYFQRIRYPRKLEAAAAIGLALSPATAALKSASWYTQQRTQRLQPWLPTTFLTFPPAR